MGPVTLVTICGLVTLVLVREIAAFATVVALVLAAFATVADLVLAALVAPAAVVLATLVAPAALVLAVLVATVPALAALVVVDPVLAIVHPVAVVVVPCLLLRVVLGLAVVLGLDVVLGQTGPERDLGNWVAGLCLDWMLVQTQQVHRGLGGLGGLGTGVATGSMPSLDRTLSRRLALLPTQTKTPQLPS